MADSTLRKYIWLINTILDAGKLTFREISEKCIIRKSKNSPKPIRKVQNPLKIGQNHNSKGLLNCKSRNIIKQKSVGNNINPTLFCFNHATL